MPALNPTRENAMILVALLFVQLLLMAGSVRGEQGSSLLEMGLMRVTRPLVGLAGAVGSGVRGSVRGLSELLGAKAENERLRARLSTLETEIRRIRDEGQENRRLRRLLRMREDLAPQSVGASVVRAEFSDRTRMIVVDRGTAHGVHADLPVIAWGGAVGRVVSAGRHLAKVRLITDPNSGIAGIVRRSDVEGMVLGHGESHVEMLYVPKFSDVMLGDRVVTSGLDGVFPRGLGIGRVAFVGEDTGISKVVRLRPEVTFSALEEVLVLLEPVGAEILDPTRTGGDR